MARRILAVLLAAMALGQASDPVGFVDIIETYDLGGRGVAWIVAATLLIGEAIAAIGLLRGAPGARKMGAAVGLGVAVLWSGLAVQAFARGLVIPNCGCFGVHLGQPLRWWILLEDAEFIALAWWVQRRTKAASSPVTAAPIASLA